MQIPQSSIVNKEIVRVFGTSSRLTDAMVADANPSILKTQTHRLRIGNSAVTPLSIPSTIKPPGAAIVHCQIAKEQNAYPRLFGLSIPTAGSMGTRFPHPVKE